MSETDPKKRGFFSRLFGLEAETPPPPAVAPESEAPPAPEPDALIAPDVMMGESAPLPLVSAEPEPSVVPPVEVPAPAAAGKRSWWRRLTEGLSRTSSALTTGISDLFTKRKLDACDAGGSRGHPDPGRSRPCHLGPHRQGGG